MRRKILDSEIECIARALLQSYCPLSWPIAWNGANKLSRDGWRRTAKRLIKKLDAHRAALRRHRARFIKAGGK